MALPIDTSGFIGQIIVGLNNITGSLFLTLLLILIIFIVIATALRIPSPFIAIIFLPLIITIQAYTGDFLAVFGTLLIYLGWVLASTFSK